MAVDLTISTPATRIFRCPQCQIAWTDIQAIWKKGLRGKINFCCRQDGNKLRDITKTKRGKVLLRYYNEMTESVA